MDTEAVSSRIKCMWCAGHEQICSLRSQMQLCVAPLIECRYRNRFPSSSRKVRTVMV